MNFKRISGLLALLVILAFPASASMVSFVIIETGLMEGTVDPQQYASLWEGSLMEVFFDAGHIVTNGPIMRLESRPGGLSGSLEAGFEDALSGGAEYFIMGFLEFTFQGTRQIPSGITLKIYETNSRELIYEQEFAAGTGRNTNEESNIAQSAGRIIVSYIRNR